MSESNYQLDSIIDYETDLLQSDTYPFVRSKNHQLNPDSIHQLNQTWENDIVIPTPSIINKIEV